MKEYKVVYLNEGARLSRKKDLKVTEQSINDMVSEGWELQQVVSPADLAGALIGIFSREKKYN